MRRRGDTDWVLVNRLNRTRPTPRTATIRRIIETARANGEPAPSDAEIGRLLAITPAKVRHHRDMLKL